ncbi:MAG: hypothetical protein P8H65_10020 [Rhodothermales bacterium]|mgnify:CR=1 FL=1|nr:hypothetical protein [Rhodothermales bacterium]MDG2016040.1 hypothetical protein [Rhodothermales bacterium]HAY36297.1 hypothetical protein [Bacteroidota bacterium]
MVSRFSYLWIVLLVLGGCNSENHDSEILVRVGSASITVKEFNQDFEQGFPELKQGSDPQMAYLERMIAEQLLAQAGYRISLDSLALVQGQIKSLTEELLVGRVFEEDAARSVVVTPADIDSLRRLDAIQIALRFLPASDLESAEQLRTAYVENGFYSAVAQLSASEEGMHHLRPQDLETDLVSPSSLDPVVWEAIRTLPLEQVSSPISYRGGFLLVEVMDILRTPITAEPGVEEWARYEQVAFAEKSRTAARSLIQRTVADRDLRLKGAAFRRLEQALWNWLSKGQENEKTGTLSLWHRLAMDSTSATEAVRNLEAQTIMETSERSWTVAEFLADYPHNRYPLSLRSQDEFRSDYYNAFGLLVRDRLFIRKALDEGFDETPELVVEVERWTDKWVYEAYKNQVADRITVAEEDLLLYFERYRSDWPDDVSLESVRVEVEDQVRRAKMIAALDRELIDLRMQIPVEIDYSVLEQVNSTALDLHSPSVQLFKASTGRPAWPVTDYGL